MTRTPAPGALLLIAALAGLACGGPPREATEASPDGSRQAAGQAPPAQAFPDIPVYPGAEPENRSSVKTADSVTGSFKLATGDPVADVIAFYRDELKKAGFEISVNTFSGDGSEGGMVNGTDTTDNRTVMAIIDREDDTTTAGITFSEGS